MEVCLAFVLVLLISGVLVVNVIKVSEQASLSTSVAQLKSDIVQARIDAMADQHLRKIVLPLSQNYYEVYVQKEGVNEWILEKKSPPFKHSVVIESTTLDHDQVVFNSDGSAFQCASQDSPSDSLTTEVNSTRNIILSTGDSQKNIVLSPGTALPF